MFRSRIRRVGHLIGYSEYPVDDVVYWDKNVSHVMNIGH